MLRNPVGAAAQDWFFAMDTTVEAEAESLVEVGEAIIGAYEHLTPSKAWDLAFDWIVGELPGNVEAADAVIRYIRSDAGLSSRVRKLQAKLARTLVGYRDMDGTAAWLTVALLTTEELDDMEPATDGYEAPDPVYWEGRPKF